MTAEAPLNRADRRVPTQERSRRKVARMLDAAAEEVLATGVESLTTKAIALRAGVPVASLYQYFRDKEEVLLALIERDTDAMDAQVVADLAEAGDLDSIAAFVALVQDAFVSVYLRSPSFVEIYLRGRTNTAVHRYGREHNARIATLLREWLIGAGLIGPDFTPAQSVLAVEVGDRLFQLAFEHDDAGDPVLLAEGRRMLIGYLESAAPGAAR